MNAIIRRIAWNNDRLRRTDAQIVSYAGGLRLIGETNEQFVSRYRRNIRAANAKLRSELKRLMEVRAS